ncbi:MAG: hypothetical protein R6X02_05425 [Enhygromyxa sp.]
MKEALGVDPRQPGYNARRAEELQMLRMTKKQDCTCDGKVFPSPPCDVFRAPDSERHKAIEGEWDEKRDHYKRWYGNMYGVTLQGWPHFAGLMKASLPASTQAAMQAAVKLPKTERHANKFGKLLDDLTASAKKLERINHLTPKEFGGCPTNPDNLQPQQTLCLACQGIDQFMTDNW